MCASDVTARDPSAAPDFAPSASEAPERASISTSNNSQNSGAPIQMANSTAATAVAPSSAVATESKLEVGTPAVTQNATVPAEASSSSFPSNGAASRNCACKVPHLNSRKRDSKRKKKKVTHKLSRILSESSDTDDSSSSISSLSTFISANDDASEFDPTEQSSSESESDDDSNAVNGSKATKRNQKTKAKLKKISKKKKSPHSHRVVTDSNSDASAEDESDNPIDEKKLERVLTKVLARHTATIAPKDTTNENLQQQADILARLLAIAVTGTGNADAVNGNPGSKKPNAYHASPTNGQVTDNGLDLLELKSKEKKKTKKKATKVEFKRVDQRKDSDITGPSFSY